MTQYQRAVVSEKILCVSAVNLGLTLQRMLSNQSRKPELTRDVPGSRRSRDDFAELENYSTVTDLARLRG